MNQEQLIEALRNEEITLSAVIDAVIEVNALVGVGVISLGDDTRDYILSHLHKESR